MDHSLERKMNFVTFKFIFKNICFDRKLHKIDKINKSKEFSKSFQYLNFNIPTNRSTNHLKTILETGTQTLPLISIPKSPSINQIRSRIIKSPIINLQSNESIKSLKSNDLCKKVELTTINENSKLNEISNLNK